MSKIKSDRNYFSFQLDSSFSLLFPCCLGVNYELLGKELLARTCVASLLVFHFAATTVATILSTTVIGFSFSASTKLIKYWSNVTYYGSKFHKYQFGWIIDPTACIKSMKM